MHYRIIKSMNMNNKSYIFSMSSYKTHPQKISLFARLLPSIYFYIKTIWLIMKSGYKAHHNKYTAEDWIHSSECTVHILEKTGCHIEVQGIKYIHTTKEPCVIIANHMSTLETFVLPSIIQPWKPTTFVIKNSLLSYPFFGDVLRSRDPITIERINPRKDFSVILEEGLKRLKSGISIIIFPQSTRSTNFIPEKFNSIGIKLAKYAHVPVIPLALKSDAWGNGYLIKDFGRIQTKKTIHFTFSNPIHIIGNGKQEHEDICNFIKTSIADWTHQEFKNYTKNK